jgi:hypothetical protein
LFPTSCLHRPQIQETLPAPYQSQEKPLPAFLNYQAKDTDAKIPEWADLFFRGGPRLVETLPQYAGSYVFAAEERGPKLDALKQWAEGFRVDQDFPLLAAQRVQERLTGNGSVDPDMLYGRWFEAFVKNASDASYQGVQKAAEFWVESAGTPDEGAVYDYVILITIDRVSLREQMRRVMNSTIVVAAPTKAQISLINRAKEHFFEGF